MAVCRHVTALWAASHPPCRKPATYTPPLHPFSSCAQFLVITDDRPDAPTTLPAFMARYEAIRPFGGLVVTEVVFGSSGHIKRPEVRVVLCQP